MTHAGIGVLNVVDFDDARFTLSGGHKPTKPPCDRPLQQLVSRVTEQACLRTLAGLLPQERTGRALAQASEQRKSPPFA